MPFLHSTVDKLYHSVMDHMPQAFQDRDMSSAFLLGCIGTYGLVKGLQATSKKAMNKLIPDFDEKYLPVLEKLCITGMVVAPVTYGLVDPQGAKEIVTGHPVYTSGMAGVGVGGIAGAVQDLNNRSQEKV